jgi:histidinol phosphate aminotransferase apoenzyme (EC 2.6.1.9)
VALETITTIYEATSYGHGRAGVVVVDEAYTEFARTGTRSALTLLPGVPGCWSAAR